jgi:hypothetical protein
MSKRRNRYRKSPVMFRSGATQTYFHGTNPVAAKKIRRTGLHPATYGSLTLSNDSSMAKRWGHATIKVKLTRNQAGAYIGWKEAVPVPYNSRREFYSLRKTIPRKFVR